MTGGRTLVILGHPDLGASRVNASLVAGLSDVETVDVRDLYALYPHGRIDLEAERRALEAVDHIVLQYPTQWYAPPALLKAWLDEVMTRGWAYGTGVPGVLVGKTIRIATTTGGTAEMYGPGGFHGWTMADVLIPMRATAKRLGLVWVDPFVVHDVRGLSDEQLAGQSVAYAMLLAAPPAPAPALASPAAAAA
ncbi:NAD(P)H-dependent oxidoreductase [Plantibacter sp. YIM 135347]|uniref:NAD(P)H-dependent oxidoreductase n=1 Tax=Plantibacter sp. YIM 135347 TaxID=3423919 RepID=UPI003D33D2FB